MEEQNQVVVEPVVQEAAPQPKNDSIAQNLYNMRKRLDAEESARIQAENRAKELEDRMQNLQPKEQQSDEDDALEDDAYVEAKHIKKTNKQFKSKLTASEERLAAMEQRVQYMEAKSELDSIKDFNEVVTEDNLKTFARLYPDDYEGMMANPSLKTKSKMAYNMIKNYGIIDAVPALKNLENAAAVDKRIEQNKAKPMASTPSSTPLSKYGRYDEMGRLKLSEDDAKRIQTDMRIKMGIR